MIFDAVIIYKLCHVIFEQALRKGRGKKSEKLKKEDFVEILKGANIEFEERTKQDTFKILKSGNLDILVGKGNKPVITVAWHGIA